MSLIDLPDTENIVLNGTPRLNSPTQVNRSRWTGARKVIGQPGAETWTASVTIGPLVTEEEERPWRAFLFALGGPVNAFRWPLPCNSHLGGKPTVDSGASNGYALPLTGMAASTTILRAGQWMTVPLPSGKYRAVCLTADLVSNSSGKATANFKPALGEKPTLGATVETGAPFIDFAPTASVMGLESDDGVSGISFDVEEAR